MLDGREIKSDQIPNFIHVGQIQSVEELGLLQIYPGRIEYYNREKINIPFKVRIKSLLGYFIFKADYYSLGEEHSISIEENDDLTFIAEEYYSLEIEGIISIDVNSKEISESILSDDEVSNFLSEVEIFVESITDIEVVA